MTPDQYTRNELQLDVGDGHSLYVHDWGLESGPVTIHLHGGPGEGSSDSSKSRYNPTRQRVIFFDQRSCGKSTPYGSLEHNTTEDLIADITKIADKFGIPTFTLAGGSWGSTLALLYGIKHPERVLRIVGWGIFTGRASEVAHVRSGAFRAFYPEVWEQFVGTVPAEHATNPFGYHVPRILGDDPAAAKASAFAYSQAIYAILFLDDRPKSLDYETFDPTSILLECHYDTHDNFIPDNYIVDNAHKLTMPVHLIQGRYDVLCPPTTAYELAQKLPNGQLLWTTAGHAGSDRANWDLARSLLLA